MLSGNHISWLPLGFQFPVDIQPWEYPGIVSGRRYICTLTTALNPGPDICDGVRWDVVEVMAVKLPWVRY